MVNAVNNGFVLSFQREDSAPVSLGVSEEFVKKMLAFGCAGSPPDFKTCTLVCRNWKQIVLEKEFYQNLGEEFYQNLYQRISPHLFGRADYLQYIGGDPGPELPVPLEFLL